MPRADSRDRNDRGLFDNHLSYSEAQGEQKLHLKCVNQWQEFPMLGKERTGDHSDGNHISGAMNHWAREKALSRVSRCPHKTSQEGFRVGAPTPPLRMNNTSQGRPSCFSLFCPVFSFTPVHELSRSSVCKPPLTGQAARVHPTSLFPLCSTCQVELRIPRDETLLHAFIF